MKLKRRVVGQFDFHSHRGFRACVKTSLRDNESLNSNAKDAKGIRKGTQRKPSSATFAQDFATFALKFLLVPLTS